MLRRPACPATSPGSHPPGLGRVYPALMIGTLTLGCASAALAQDADPARSPAPAAAATGCLEDGSGLLQARLAGSVQADLAWHGSDLECTGHLRPDGGMRLRFSHEDPLAGTLVVVFGMARIQGAQARELPVNITVIREGQGEFYSTQGDDKCLLDELELAAPATPGTARQVTARGFCTQPARAVRGEGAVLISRFDFIGRLDPEPDPDLHTPLEPAAAR